MTSYYAYKRGFIIETKDLIRIFVTTEEKGSSSALLKKSLPILDKG